MTGLIGRKLGMTSIFKEDGTNIPCTIIEAGPCFVSQMKNEDSDGYDAVQLTFGQRKEKNVSKALLGHLQKSNQDGVQKIKEFRNFEGEVELGGTVDVGIFEEGDIINVVGKSKGKGFQGVVKRHNFHGVGQATHGQHNRLRAPGSIGAASYPARVFKGMRMAGRTGNNQIKVKNLEVIKIFKDKNLLLVKGGVPGAKGSILFIEK